MRSRQARVNSTGEIFFARICSEACRRVHCVGEAARPAAGAASSAARTSLRVGEESDMRHSLTLGKAIVDDWSATRK